MEKLQFFVFRYHRLFVCGFYCTVSENLNMIFTFHIDFHHKSSYKYPTNKLINTNKITRGAAERGQTTVNFGSSLTLQIAGRIDQCTPGYCSNFQYCAFLSPETKFSGNYLSKIVGNGKNGAEYLVELLIEFLVQLSLGLQIFVASCHEFVKSFFHLSHSKF